ncbi:MAG: non-ribosomal peptide synthetase [Xenococcaceae cyanobacterium]
MTSPESKVIFTPVEFDPFADGEILLAALATESQKEIWASVQMGKEANCAYNESQSLKLKGNLHFKAFEAALQELIQRHEALRTTFSRDGVSVCIADTLSLDLASLDLSDLDLQTRQTEVLRSQKQAVSEPFDLEKGPLFRIQIIKLEAQEHLIILTAHHIICDGWSWAVLITDLGQLYSAFKQGITPDLEQSDRFSDYARMLELEASSEETLEIENYWLKQFQGNIPVLDFPCDRPRPPLRTFDSDREDWELDASLVRDLKQLGTEIGCSFMTVLLAGFEVFLYRLTGSEDIVVGVPTAGQADKGKYNLVGHCVNLLPIRSRVNGKLAFSEYLKLRKTSILDAYDHQQFTFGSLIEKLDLPRDPSRIPLIPIVFNIDRGLDTNSLNFEGLEVEFYTNPRTYENFELFINAVELKDKVTLECQYNTNLFDRETISRRLAEFATLLLGIVANAEEAIATLPLLPETELKLLQKWNQTQVDYPESLCIHQLVEAQVEKTPDAIAVVFEDKQITYRELDRQANLLAAHLIELGVKPDVLVGICVERSVEMVVGLLGILKAGGAYVPIDPSYPSERISFVLEDAQVRVLVTQTSLESQLPPHSAITVCLDRDWKNISDSDRNALTSKSVNSENLAYIIYTSGSTGQPKGVLIRHRNAVNLLTSVQKQPGLTAADTLLSVTTISFDIAVSELFLPLSVGAKLVLVSSQVASDGMQLLQALNTSGATFMQPTPITWRLLLEAGWQGNSNLKAVSTGEALPRELANRLLPMVAELWNLYGPTETTIWSTSCQVRSGDRAIDIGKPISNTQVYILDANLQPVPIGVPGELHIGGEGVSKGYLNRPNLTKEKFIANPFSSDPNSKLYKTGDLARFLPDGQIECLGRTDYQVKMRGFRIELGEIEAIMGQYSAVKEAVAIVREDTPGAKTLIGYFVANAIDKDAASQQIPELRRFLKQRLPEYMVPTIFMVVDAMPLTPNGKIDRKALPQPDSLRLELVANYVEPRNDLERQITEIWAEVLNLESVGIHDNFFELGGYSLLGIQIVSRLRQALQIEILLSNLFELPTIAELSARIETLRWATQSQQFSDNDLDEDYEEGEL